MDKIKKIIKEAIVIIRDLTICTPILYVLFVWSKYKRGEPIPSVSEVFDLSHFENRGDLLILVFVIFVFAIVVYRSRNILKNWFQR